MQVNGQTSTALDLVVKKNGCICFLSPVHLNRRLVACKTLGIYLDALSGAQEYRLGSVFDAGAE